MISKSNLPHSLKTAFEELKFIYFEKATNFCEMSSADLSYVVTVKSMVEISQNFVYFSEYMNFTPAYCNIENDIDHQANIIQSAVFKEFGPLLFCNYFNAAPVKK